MTEQVFKKPKKPSEQILLYIKPRLFKFFGHLYIRPKGYYKNRDPKEISKFERQELKKARECVEEINNIWLEGKWLTQKMHEHIDLLYKIESNEQKRLRELTAAVGPDIDLGRIAYTEIKLIGDKEVLDTLSLSNTIEIQQGWADYYEYDILKEFFEQQKDKQFTWSMFRS